MSDHTAGEGKQSTAHHAGQTTARNTKAEIKHDKKHNKEKPASQRPPQPSSTVVRDYLTGRPHALRAVNVNSPQRPQSQAQQAAVKNKQHSKMQTSFTKAKTDAQKMKNYLSRQFNQRAKQHDRTL